MKHTTRPMVTEELWLEHRESYVGLCADCGEERETCEPDAREYPCEACGLAAVFGAEAYAFEGCEYTDQAGERVLVSWTGGFADA